VFADLEGKKLPLRLPSLPSDFKLPGFEGFKLPGFDHRPETPDAPARLDAAPFVGRQGHEFTDLELTVPAPASTSPSRRREARLD